MKKEGIPRNRITKLGVRQRRHGNEEVLRLADLAEYFPGASGLHTVLQGQPTALKQYPVYTGAPHLNKLNFYLEEPNEGWRSNAEYFVDYETVISTPTGLALSGGGFRATLFHLGALQRLNELGVLSQVGTVTSVSGGSIINVHWNDLKDHGFSEEAFDALIRRPVRKFAEYNFAARIIFHPKEVFKRLFPRKLVTSATSLADAYIKAERKSKEKVKAELEAEFQNNTLTEIQIEKYRAVLPLLDKTAFDKPLLQALPDPQGMGGPPLFVFCGCDMRSGRAIYFTQRRVSQDLYAPTIITQYHRYDIPEPRARALATEVTLAQAVAASSAHPFFAQPLKVGYENSPGEASVLPVIDGGVVDNIGFDPLLLPNSYKCLNTVPLPHVNVFISNAGAPVPEVDEPHTNIAARLLRALSLVGVQSERLRVRMLKENITSKKMYGSWWGLNDLWRYYLASKSTKTGKQISDSPQSDHKNEPATVQEETVLKSNERKPIQLQPLIDFLNDPNNTFLKLTNIIKPLTSWSDVKNLIRLVTTFRTDLNYINNKEQNMLESMGYLICTYNVECYAAPFMKRRMAGQWKQVAFDPLGRYTRFLKAPEIQSAFGHSQNVFTSFIRNTWKRIMSSENGDSTSFTEHNAPPTNPVGA